MNYSAHVVEDQYPRHSTAADECLVSHIVDIHREYFSLPTKQYLVLGSPTCEDLGEWKLSPFSPIHLKVFTRQSLESPDSFLLRHFLLPADALHPLVEDAVATLIGILCILSQFLATR